MFNKKCHFFCPAVICTNKVKKVVNPEYLSLNFLQLPYLFSRDLIWYFRLRCAPTICAPNVYIYIYLYIYFYIYFYFYIYMYIYIYLYIYIYIICIQTCTKEATKNGGFKIFAENKMCFKLIYKRSTHFIKTGQKKIYIYINILFVLYILYILYIFYIDYVYYILHLLYICIYEAFYKNSILFLKYSIHIIHR